MKLINFQKIIDNLSFTYNRFTLGFILAFVVSWFFASQVAFDAILSGQTEEMIWKIIFSGIVTYFLSNWVYLVSESLEWSRVKSNLLQLPVIVFWVLFYFYLWLDFWESIESIIAIFMTLIWTISLMFCAYFIKNSFNSDKYDQEKYFHYFYNIGLSFFFSFVFWISLLILGFIAITSVDVLFDLSYSWYNDLYPYWAIFSLSLSAPIFGLSKIPASNKILKDEWLNKFFIFLVKYLLVSFVIIYFLILYAYTVKVLLNFSDWPKWEVAWLVIWFSILWYITYTLSYSLAKENDFIKLFRKVFPYVVVPQVFMLFYAIYLRIGQYDITVNRYFVVVFGIWLLCLSLYFIFSRKKFLAFIFFMLIDFIIIISIWPWSVYSLPESRQLQRLEQNLSEAWILDVSTWKITPLENKADIDKKLSENIYSWIDYLCDFDNCNSIKSLFPKRYSELVVKDKKNFIPSGYQKTYKWPSKWEIVNDITSYIKVEHYYSYLNSYKMEDYEFISFTSDEKSLYPIDIAWYDFLLELTSYSWDWEYIFIDSEKEIIQYIDKGWVPIDNFDFKVIKDILLEKVPDFSYSNKLEKEDLVFVLSWEKYDLKIYFSSLPVKNPKFIESSSSRKFYNSYVNWVVLVRER